MRRRSLHSSSHRARPGSVAALAWTFAQRDLKARFKGTLLGWIWSLIVPLASLGLYALVFGLIFRAQVQPLGNGHAPIYAVWLFGGLIAFNFFANGVARGAESLWGLAGVMNKVRIPILTPILGSLIAVALQSLVELLLYMGVLAALLNVGWSWLLVPAWAFLLFLFIAGLSVSVAIVAAYYRDIMQLLAVVLQFAFFATPVMYPLTMIPEQAGSVALRDVIGSSPLARFVDMIQSLLYDLEPGTGSEWVALALWAIGALLLGAVVARRFGADVAERLQ